MSKGGCRAGQADSSHSLTEGSLPTCFSERPGNSREPQVGANIGQPAGLSSTFDVGVNSLSPPLTPYFMVGRTMPRQKPTQNSALLLPRGT